MSTLYHFRFLAKIVAFSTTVSNWLLSGLVNRVPIIATVIMLSMVPATCAALPMLLSIFVHFLRLTNIYEDYLEKLFFTSLKYFNIPKRHHKSKDSEEECSTTGNLLNQLLLFLFWCMAAAPAIPTALVWAKNFRWINLLCIHFWILRQFDFLFVF